MLQDSRSLSDNIKNISSILSFVEETSSQSHLLGLNPAIEAARAGEHGLRFNVVATEIRKMADHRNGAVSNIGQILNEIKKDILKMDESIGQISGFTQEHAASMEELSASFGQIGKIVSNLADEIHKSL